MFARTARLLLRPAWPEDAPALHAAIADEAVVRNLATAPWPYLPEHASAWIGREAGSAPPLLVVEPAGTIVGAISVDRTDDGGAPELGYWIARDRWGRGYATEAGRAMMAIAQGSLALRRVEAGHFDDNPVSGRVLRKLGFVATGETRPHHSAARGRAAASVRYRWTAGPRAG